MDLSVTIQESQGLKSLHQEPVSIQFFREILCKQVILEDAIFELLEGHRSITKVLLDNQEFDEGLLLKNRDGQVLNEILVL